MIGFLFVPDEGLSWWPEFHWSDMKLVAVYFSDLNRRRRIRGLGFSSHKLGRAVALAS